MTNKQFIKDIKEHNKSTDYITKNILHHADNPPFYNIFAVVWYLAVPSLFFTAA